MSVKYVNCREIFERFMYLFKVRFILLTFDAQYMLAIIHGNPNPRNTLTELLPVTLPIALSAYFSCLAAAMEANKSGRDVPSATNVMAVTASFRCTRQPKILAMSPMIAVRMPIRTKDVKNVSHPPRRPVGGTIAKTA